MSRSVDKKASLFKSPLDRLVGVRIARVTVGGNFVGIAVVMAFFTFFGKHGLQSNIIPVILVTLLLFAAQTLASRKIGLAWQKEIQQFIIKKKAGQDIPPEMAAVARRKILNLPFLVSGLSLANWLLSAVLLPLIFFLLEYLDPDSTGSFDRVSAFRFALVLVLAGMVTGVTNFFTAELYSRRGWPFFFEQGHALGVRGAVRIGIRARLLLTFAFSSIMPLFLMALLTFHRTRLFVSDNPFSDSIESLFGLYAFLFGVALFLSIVFSRLLSKSLVDPVLALVERMKQAARGDLTSRVPVTSIDELGFLAEGFNRMIQGLADRERMKAFEFELEKGRQIQLDFLPASLPRVPGWDLAACFHPAHLVSGDFYDVFVLDEGRLVLVLGDVCDKGVGSALFMALIRSLVRVFSQHGEVPCAAKHEIAPPEDTGFAARILGHLNTYMVRQHGDLAMFATVFIAILDPGTGEMEYCNAGHEPPLVISKNQSLEELRPTGPAVGLFEEAVFQAKKKILEPGQTLFVCTDGITEATAQNGGLFGRSQVEEMLGDCTGTARCILDQVEDAVMVHMDEEPQHDDITMLAIQRRGEGKS